MMESSILKTDYDKICRICLQAANGLKKFETEFSKLFNIYNLLPVSTKVGLMEGAGNYKFLVIS